MAWSRATVRVDGSGDNNGGEKRQPGPPVEDHGVCSVDLVYGGVVTSTQAS